MTDGSPGPRPGNQLRGAAGAATAMFCVGTLTGVSPILHHYPVYGGQALRYAVGAVLLLLAARAMGLRHLRLSAREVLLVLALAATGLAAFNVFIVEATRYANPAVVGTIVATVVIILAVVGPLQQRRRPAVRIVFGAAVVVCGALLATGLGGASSRLRLAAGPRRTRLRGGILAAGGAAAAPARRDPGLGLRHNRRRAPAADHRRHRGRPVGAPDAHLERNGGAGVSRGRGDGIRVLLLVRRAAQAGRGAGRAVLWFSADRSDRVVGGARHRAPSDPASWPGSRW